MPYDVAFSLPYEDIAAYGIIFGELADSGNIYDWDAMRWRPKE